VQVIVGENCYEVTKPAAKAIMREAKNAASHGTVYAIQKGKFITLVNHKGDGRYFRENGFKIYRKRVVYEDGREYTSFISQTLDRLKQYDVRSLAIVALTNGEDDSVTAYWNASLNDIIKSKDVIEYDAIDRFIEANLQRYQAILNEQLENDD